MINRLIHKAYLHSIKNTWAEFQSGLSSPQEIQQHLLLNCVKENQSTRFGEKHDFQKIRTLADYQAAVPVSSYETLAPWIERAAAGEPHVLTTDSIRIFERTSGSTSTNKLIPYTPTFLNQLNHGTQAWLYNIYTSLPQLQGTTSYWSISPVTRKRETTPGGTPIGMADDLEYFGPVVQWAMARLMAVPSSVAHEPTHESWQQKTCLHLLSDANLGLISVWSPTFISLLMEEIAAHFEFYLKKLSPVRARQIQEGVTREGAINGSALWPRLSLISCWTEASASQFVSRVKHWFPKQMIQGKGLLATEGIVSFPICGVDGAVAATRSHFLEFIDLDHPQEAPLGVHNLKAGGHYSPLLTTGSGLYRYHLRDVVECIGFHSKTPTLKFLGRLDGTSDLCGEKMSMHQVQEAFDIAKNALHLNPDFFMMIPMASETPYYCGLITDSGDTKQMQDFSDLLDQALQRNTHYAYCRKLGQLQRVKIIQVEKGYDRYVQASLARGMRLGDIKPAILDTKPVWRDVFAAEIEKTI